MWRTTRRRQGVPLRRKCDGVKSLRIAALIVVAIASTAQVVLQIRISKQRQQILDTLADLKKKQSQHIGSIQQSGSDNVAGVQGEVATSPQRCPSVETRKSHSGCRVNPQDGSGHCESDFLQPYKWGWCAQEKKSEALVCLNEGKISRYPASSADPEWTVTEKSCPDLAAKVKRDGQGPTMSMPLELELPDPPKGPRT